MSAAYCIIAVAMCATIKPGPNVNYDPTQMPISTLARVMGIFNAMTTVFFAYGGHNVALEIQATIGITEKNPSTVKPMMRGVNWTFLITGKKPIPISSSLRACCTPYCYRYVGSGCAAAGDHPSQTTAAASCCCAPYAVDV
jgi:hypothetical protein